MTFSKVSDDLADLVEMELAGHVASLGPEKCEGRHCQFQGGVVKAGRAPVHPWTTSSFQTVFGACNSTPPAAYLALVISFFFPIVVTYMHLWKYILCFFLLTAAQSVEVTLAPPLVARSFVEVTTAPAVLIATLEVPENAPEDLGYGICLTTMDGLWWQSPQEGRIEPGRYEIRCLIEPARLSTEQHAGRMDASRLATIRKAGFFFWGTGGACKLRLENFRFEGTASATDSTIRVLPRQNSAFDGSPLETGKPWQLELDVLPTPANPYNQNQCRVELELSGENAERHLIPGFWYEPQTLVDRGDSEEAKPTGRGCYAVRWWPQNAGKKEARLRVWTPHSGTLSSVLGNLTVIGESWDPYIRRDPIDPRYFSQGATGAKQFFWPVGINMRSITDPRSTRNLQTKITPNRIVSGYDAYFARLQASGANACEIWLASWNLALEWTDSWQGYLGRGRYNQENAARLDQVLDSAWRHGIRINLVVNNHGMGGVKNDSEWRNNPWNAKLGGPCDTAEEFFTDPQALAGQERLRRYLVARYGFHPAIWGWKLWSEMNLTAANAQIREQWMRQASIRWKALDPVGRGITCHWSGDYKTPDRSVCKIGTLDYICIDAYRNAKKSLLPTLLWYSTNHPDNGLGLLKDETDTVKPLVVTEYGGSSGAAAFPILLADHCSGPWIGLVSGHAASPMLWWWEWVDQENLWAVYHGIQAFLQGEDLRSTDNSKANPVLLATESRRLIWCGVWSRPGRILGYVLDEGWASSGDNRLHENARIVISANSKLAAGRITIEWWDPLAGTKIHQDEFQHPGGPLTITAPTFTRHLAFKLIR